MKTTTHYSTALALLSFFAGGCITILFILVPFWQTLPPQEVMQWFTDFGAQVGMTMLPMEIIPLMFTIKVYFHALKHDRPRKRLWLYANLSNVVILLMFFIYFLPVNFSFVNQTLDVTEVSAELQRWQLMHAFRTSLAVLSAGISLLIVSRYAGIQKAAQSIELSGG